MITLNPSNLSRRTFCNYLLLGTTGLIARDFLFPNQVKADSLSSYTEKYHLFIPYDTAQKGGVQSINLRSGNRIWVNIPSIIDENQEILCQVSKENTEYIDIALHSFYDAKNTLISKINDEIERHTSFINKNSSQIQCKQVLKEIQNSQPVSDLTVLELLDYRNVESRNKTLHLKT